MSQIWDVVGKFLVSLFAQKEAEVEISIPIDTPPPAPENPETIVDWNDPTCKVSKYFTVKECLWLPQWKRMATDLDGLTDQVKTNLIRLCKSLDPIREFVGHPFNVHCMYRPGPYSVLVGGTATDVHVQGMAIDFDCGTFTCDQVKALILSKLVEFGVRMEDNGAGAGWVHLDIHRIVSQAFFKA